MDNTRIMVAFKCPQELYQRVRKKCDEEGLLIGKCFCRLIEESLNRRENVKESVKEAVSNK